MKLRKIKEEIDNLDLPVSQKIRFGFNQSKKA